MFIYSDGRLFELTGATVRPHPFAGSGTRQVVVIRGDDVSLLYEADSDEEANAIVAEIARQINACLRCGKVIDLVDVVAKVRSGQQSSRERAT